MKLVSKNQNPPVLNNANYSANSKQTSYSYLLFLLAAFLIMLITSCKKNDLQDSSQNSEMITSDAKKAGNTRCVPFKASFITADEMTQAATDENPIQKDHLTGTGEGTGIGRASIEVFVEGDVTLPFPALITSTATFTAANGDKIFERGEGFLQEPAADAVLLHLTGTGTITGGTGRFAGATGNLSVDVTQNLLDPNGTVTFKGNICY